MEKIKATSNIKVDKNSTRVKKKLAVFMVAIWSFLKSKFNKFELSASFESFYGQFKSYLDQETLVEGVFCVKECECLYGTGRKFRMRVFWEKNVWKQGFQNSNPT